LPFPILFFIGLTLLEARFLTGIRPTDCWPGRCRLESITSLAMMTMDFWSIA